MEPEGSLPHSQVPATCPYPEPDSSSTCFILCVRQELKYANTNITFKIFAQSPTAYRYKNYVTMNERSWHTVKRRLLMINNLSHYLWEVVCQENVVWQCISNIYKQADGHQRLITMLPSPTAQPLPSAAQSQQFFPSSYLLQFPTLNFVSSHLYQKDERALSGNLQSSKHFVSSHNKCAVSQCGLPPSFFHFYLSNILVFKRLQWR